MTREALRHPIDFSILARKRRALREELLSRGPHLDLRIAILAGTTTADVQDFLELFLLDLGIRPTFYVSQQWYEDGAVDDTKLRAFAPDVVFIHTTHRDVRTWPTIDGDADAAFE